MSCVCFCLRRIDCGQYRNSSCRSCVISRKRPRGCCTGQSVKLTYHLTPENLSTVGPPLPSLPYLTSILRIPCSAAVLCFKSEGQNVSAFDGHLQLEGPADTSLCPVYVFPLRKWTGQPLAPDPLKATAFPQNFHFPLSRVISLVSSGILHTHWLSLVSYLKALSRFLTSPAHHYSTAPSGIII